MPDEMSESIRRQPLTIAGVYIKSDAYPSVKYRVLGLQESARFDVREINFCLRDLQAIGQERGWFDKIRRVVQLVYAHIRVLSALATSPRVHRFYLPYPGVFMLFLLSFMPRRWRPTYIVLDAFVSLYDTVVIDRRLLSKKNPLTRVLFAIERRAYQHADRVLVDTSFNGIHLAKTFALDPRRVTELPLTIDEYVYHNTEYQARRGVCRVLFIGTFVPLQGTDVIARAMVKLRNRADIQFRIVGDGQTAAQFASILSAAGYEDVSWERSWQGPTALATEIRNADICLGIFGVSDKAQRVWPLKNYSYMSVGRPIITGDTLCARQVMAGASRSPFVLVEAGNPDDLAQGIVDLARDPARRLQYAERARALYKKRFAAHESIRKLVEILNDSVEE